MSKTADLKAAKDAKQKKIVIGGAVLLVVVLVLTVPRTLKMVHGKATPAPVAAPSVAKTMPTATPTASSPSASATPVSQVLSAPLEPAAHDGQLARLSPTFRTKDPFVQQMTADDASGGDASSSGDAVGAKKQPKTKEQADTSAHASSRVGSSKAPAQPVTLPAPSVPTPSASPTAPSTPTAPSAPTSHPSVEPYVSATISIDGVAEGVNVKSDFPVDSPLFHLVSAGKKTAVITIAGGSLANGAPTLTLHVGKAVTLMNTADGTRYRVVLVATSTTPAAPPVAAPGGAPTPAATAPATTTPTTTTPTTPTTQTTGG